MIFVSVGTQLPFPRMLEVIDAWAKNKDVRIVAQTAESKKYKNLECYQFLNAADFKEFYNMSEVVVSHAGMGNIISALELKKPIIIFPRDASLQEHRNDHQKATAIKFSSKSGVYVCNDLNSFEKSIDEVVTNLSQDMTINEPVELERHIIGFIEGVFK
jgi:UDP-N-acetylglucosamine transferase subunit ALG13